MMLPRTVLTFCPTPFLLSSFFPPLWARFGCAAVVVGFDRNINYYKIQYAQLCINENPGCEFIATNTDAVTHLTDAQVTPSFPVARQQPLCHCRQKTPTFSSCGALQPRRSKSLGKKQFFGAATVLGLKARRSAQRCTKLPMETLACSSSRMQNMPVFDFARGSAQRMNPFARILTLAALRQIILHPMRLTGVHHSPPPFALFCYLPRFCSPRHCQEWAGNGAMVGAIKGCTGVEPTIVGKPSPLMIDYIIQKYSVERCVRGVRSFDSFVRSFISAAFLLVGRV